MKTFEEIKYNPNISSDYLRVQQILTNIKRTFLTIAKPNESLDKNDDPNYFMAIITSLMPMLTSSKTLLESFLAKTAALTLNVSEGSVIELSNNVKLVTVASIIADLSDKNDLMKECFNRLDGFISHYSTSEIESDPFGSDHLGLIESAIVKETPTIMQDIFIPGLEHLVPGKSKALLTAIFSIMQNSSANNQPNF